MSYDPMNQPGDPWEQNTYQTGSTCPPKSKKGLIAILLVIIIMLCGAVTILGVMNIRLFKQMNAANGETLPICFYQIDATDGNTLATDSAIPSVGTDPSEAFKEPIEVASTPTSEANVPREGGLSLHEIYSKAIGSVVSISSSYRGGSSTGTGVVLTEDGYIVTNCHVVEDAESITIQLSDSRIMEARLIGADAISDLAVLQVDAENLVAAQLGDSSVLRVGDTVVAIGDPLGAELRGTMTDGIISAINRDVNVDGRVMNLIQTNAALNSGNSGGPLINCYGQVIGINTMKIGDYMNSAGVEGLGFAIPSNTVSQIVNQLISQGFVSGRPSLGIIGEDVSQLYQFYYNLPSGFYVTEVIEDGPADETGLEEGDIIVSIGGVRITCSDDLDTQLYNYEPGDTLEVIIYRNGRRYSGTITVGEANQ